MADKQKYAPNDRDCYLELELWPYIVERCGEELTAWLKKYNLPDHEEGFHLDEKNNVEVKIVRVGRPIPEQAVSELNQLLRIGAGRLPALRTL